MKKYSISLGQDGCIVIPVIVRKYLGLKTGQRLCLHLEDHKIILRKSESIVQKLQERFNFIKPSLSEELIEERKKENL